MECPQNQTFVLPKLHQRTRASGLGIRARINPGIYFGLETQTRKLRKPQTGFWESTQKLSDRSCPKSQPTLSFAASSSRGDLIGIFERFLGEVAPARYNEQDGIEPQTWPINARTRSGPKRRATADDSNEHVDASPTFAIERIPYRGSSFRRWTLKSPLTRFRER